MDYTFYMFYILALIKELTNDKGDADKSLGLSIP